MVTLAPWAQAQDFSGSAARLGKQGSEVVWVQRLALKSPTVPWCLMTHLSHPLLPLPASLLGLGPEQPASLSLLLPHSPETGLKWEQFGEVCRHFSHRKCPLRAPQKW